MNETLVAFSVVLDKDCKQYRGPKPGKMQGFHPQRHTADRDLANVEKTRFVD